MSGRIDIILVCGGLYHDTDYARCELLKHLQKFDRLRVRVFEDYANTDAIAAADVLITYTTHVLPNAEQRAVLDEFLKSGKRWFALHGTNSVIDIDEKGYASSPRTEPEFMAMLGSQFIAHPPKGPFTVHNANPDHPLVQGIESFEVEDELYLLEEHGPNEVLLYAEFNGKAMRGFTEREWYSNDKRPILYLHNHGKGEILYLNLGHCRSRYDMEPLMSEYPEIERCSWLSPVFHTLLQRGILWATRIEEKDCK